MRASVSKISLSMLSPFSSTSESGNLLQSPDRESETPNSTPILSQGERKSKRVSSLGSMAIAMGFKSKQPATNASSSLSNLKPKNGNKTEGTGSKALEAAASMLGLANKQSAFQDTVTSSTSLLSPNNDIISNSRNASVAIVSGQAFPSSFKSSVNEEAGEVSSAPSGSKSSSKNLQLHHKPRLTVQPLLLKPAMQSCLKNAYRLSLPNGVGGGTSLVDQSQLSSDPTSSIGVLPYPTPSIIFPSQTTLFQVGSDLSSSTSNVEVDPSIAHLDFRNHSQTILELDEQRRASDPDVKSAFERELFEWLDTEGKSKAKRKSNKSDEGIVGNGNSGQWSQFNGQEDGNESELESQGYRADVDDFGSPCLGSEQYKRGSRIHTYATRRPMSGRRAAAEVGLGLESQESIPKALKAPRFRETVTEIVSTMTSNQGDATSETSSDHQGQADPQGRKSTHFPPPRPSKSRARGVTLSATGAAADFDYSFQSKDSSGSPRTGVNPRKQKFSDPFASLDPFIQSANQSKNNSPIPSASASQNLSSRARAISSPSLLQSSTFSASHEPLCTSIGQDSGSCCPSGSNQNAQVGRLHTRRPAGLQLASLPKASLWAPVEIRANGGSLIGRDMRAPAVIDPRKSESEACPPESNPKVRRSGSRREEKNSIGNGVGVGIGLGLGLGSKDSRGGITEPLRPPRRQSVLKPTPTDAAPSSPPRNRSVSAVPLTSEVSSSQEKVSAVKEIGLGFSPTTFSRARSVTTGAFVKPKIQSKELSPRLDDEEFLRRAEAVENKGISSSLLGLSLPLPMKGLDAPNNPNSPDLRTKSNKHTSLPARFIAPDIPPALATPFIDLDAPHLDTKAKQAMADWICETIKATQALGSLGQSQRMVEAPATARSNISTSLFSPNPWNKKQLSTSIAQQSGMMRWDLEGASTSDSSNPSEKHMKKEEEEKSSTRIIPIKLVKSFSSPSEISEDENSLLVSVKSPLVSNINEKGLKSSNSFQLAPPSCAITLNSNTSEESVSAPLFKLPAANKQARVSKVPLVERERRNANSLAPMGSNHGKEAEWFKSTPSPIMMPSKFKSYTSNSTNPTTELAKSLGLCHLISPEAQKKISISPKIGVSSPRIGSPHPLSKASRFDQSSGSEEEELLSEEEKEITRPTVGRLISSSSSVDSREGLLFETKGKLNHSLNNKINNRTTINKSRTQSKQRRPLTAPSRSPSTSKIHPADCSPLISRRDSFSSVGSVKMVREGSCSSFGDFMDGNETSNLSNPSSPSQVSKPFSNLIRQASTPLISFPSPLNLHQNSSINISPVLKGVNSNSPLLISLSSPAFDMIEINERRRESLGLSLTRSAGLHLDLSASTVSSGSGQDLEEAIMRQDEDSSISSSDSSDSNSSSSQPSSNQSINQSRNGNIKKSKKKSNNKPVQLIEIDLEEKLFFSAVARAKLASRIATPFERNLQLGEEEIVEIKQDGGIEGIPIQTSLTIQVNNSIQSEMCTPFSEEGAASILSGTTAC